MILQIDMGNSRIKWRLCDEFCSLASGVALLCDNWLWLQDLAKFELKCIQVSSVLADTSNSALVLACHSLSFPVPKFAKSLPAFGLLKNGYKNPAQLGVDRWLALIAAQECESGACVVVDSGSALTVDMVDANCRHVGGYIAPGLSMARRSLSQEISVISTHDEAGALAPGRTTNTAVEHAIRVMGVGLISKAIADINASVVLLTGGDACVWAPYFNDAVVKPELVLEGLGHYFA